MVGLNPVKPPAKGVIEHKDLLQVFTFIKKIPGGIMGKKTKMKAGC
jgi:hypothetical protein